MNNEEEAEAQRAHLEMTIRWAEKLRGRAAEMERELGGKAVFRPSSTGVAMIGLTSGNPQRGPRIPVRELSDSEADPEDLFRRYCTGVPGRPTPEKRLQSFLISRSLRADRNLEPLNAASLRTSAPVDLTFMIDEIPVFPVRGKKTLCDLLAIRKAGTGFVPVVIELKSSRQMTRLIEQVTTFAALVDTHRDLYERLFSAFCPSPIAFIGPCEKWIVWPALKRRPDPREEEFAAAGIRVVGYETAGDGFTFRVGRSLAGVMPRALSAYIGGYMGASYEVRLCESVLEYKVYSRGYEHRSTEEIIPSDAAWRVFRAAVSSAGIRKWEESYVQEDVCDGTSWSFDIDFGDHRVSSDGSNDFPDDFGALLEAIQTLLGGREFA